MSVAETGGFMFVPQHFTAIARRGCEYKAIEDCSVMSDMALIYKAENTNPAIKVLRSAAEQIHPTVLM